MTPPSETPSNESPDQTGGVGGSVAVFTMREAAQVAGVSVSTLRRRRDDLVAAGAVIDPAGWQVPITALIAAGLLPGEGQHHTPTTGTPQTHPGPGPSVASSGQGSAAQHQHELRRLQERVQELVEEVGHWRRRAEVAEARAEERGRSLETLRIANESERLALRMLTSQHAPTTTPAPADTPPAPPEDTGPTHAPAQQEAPATEQGQSRRGGFLRRLFTD